VNFQRAAEIQVLLEGVALPATRDELVRYAAREDAAAAAELERISDREYGRLDEVGEQLMPTAAIRASPDPLPTPESDEPPGGQDYVTPRPRDTGEVELDAPPDNPPQKAITEASETQKEQQEKQQS
jgi:Protein of unknown function (DUF2795)